MRNSRLGVIIAMLLMAVLFVANLLFGSVDIPASDVVSILSGRGCDNDVWRLIVLEMRLPQAVTALLAGAAISVTGLVLQTLFANPLAGPEVLGINSGAGLGVAVVMLLMQGVLAVGVAGYFALFAGAFIGAAIIIAVILFLSFPAYMLPHNTPIRGGCFAAPFMGYISRQSRSQRQQHRRRRSYRRSWDRSRPGDLPAGTASRKLRRMPSGLPR